MSNMLRKGKRQYQKQLDKKLEKTKDMFHKTLLAMNHVYTHLKDDPTVNEENLERKIKDLTDFKFSVKQIEILKTDLFKDEQDAELE